MDNQRLILFLALAIVTLFLWDAWEQKFNPQPLPVAQTDSGNVQVPSTSSTSALSSTESTADIPEVETTTDKPAINAKSVVSRGDRIRVVTDVLDMDIDSKGGDLRRAFLLKYPVSLDKKDEPYPLMDDNLPQLFIAQSGLLSRGEAPDHHASYAVEKTEYRMQPGQEELRIPMTWTSKDGKITVTKTYIFKKGNYLFEVEHEVTNNSDSDWVGRVYSQLQRNEYDEPGKSRMLYTFTGGAFSTPENAYEKIDFDEFKDWRAEQSYVKGGWVGMLQHYFVSAWIPGKEELNHFYTRSIDDTRFIIGMTGKESVVPANSTKTFSRSLYVGPKDQDHLASVADNLNLTVDYGVLTFIAKPIFWLLKTIHEYIGNWGWAIIFVTLIIKLLFYKLSAASYRSMANMRKISPKFQAIRDKYGDDRQRMSQAMMELYKKEKVNPMSGCWPMLVQIPVFISLYWVLLESVELRQAPFMLWIEDLSTKDPYYILPILMGLSMWFQQKLSANPSLDPMHQKIMQFLPIVFTFFFMLFPAGLVLYWVVNSILSILQQWYITRQIEGASK
ncbi:MAG TPA: membrane protein insertase YidC [Gammaproteobacteria bacterium]|nr:membrane protein insertase YidC [Gammaproteobacteria bacterium]